jgi:D-sedoheptulose 7-phosphate isomerase
MCLVESTSRQKHFTLGFIGIRVLVKIASSPFLARSFYADRLIKINLSSASTLCSELARGPAALSDDDNEACSKKLSSSGRIYLKIERGMALDSFEQQFVTNYLEESRQMQEQFQKSEESKKAIFDCADAITDALKSGHRLLIAGNGGGAGDAQHIAGEFLSRLFFDRAPLPAIALTTDTSVLTAVGNDYGYDHVFERQVLGLGTEGDVFLGISTSGKSRNVLRALEAARSRKMTTLGFTGSSPGDMKALCDHILCAPSTKTSVIQQIHIIAAHLVCGLVEARIFEGKRPA